MKRNAVVRILLYSLAICLLFGILPGGLLLNGFSFYTESYSGTLLKGQTETLEASQIEKIEIQWVSGSVLIHSSNTDKITFTEYGAEQDRDKLIWSVSGNTLRIQFCVPRLFGSTPDKQLTVNIPNSWAGTQVEIDNVSANITVQDVSLNDLHITTVSGKCSISGGFNRLDLETVSGPVELQGSVRSIDAESVSGDCTFWLQNDLQEMQLDSVSGDCTVYLPETAGFRTSLESLSGKLSSEFSGSTQDGQLTYGDGSRTIRCDSVSGDLTLKSLDKYQAETQTNTNPWNQ